MKVYQVNYNGRQYRLVAAKSQKEAAAKTNCSLYMFRQYCHVTGNEADIKLAMSKPGTVFEKAIQYTDTWKPVKQPK